MKRRTFFAGIITATALPIKSWAQAYPSKPIRWIVPTSAGGPTDVIARKLAELTSAKFGQNIFVDNRPGAGGAVGITEVVRAAPDGYTFAISIPDYVISTPSLVKAANYDPRTDLTLVMKICYTQLALVARPGLDVKDMRGLLAQAKASPGKLSYGTWGPGSTPHLTMKSLEGVTATSFLEVPYKGLAQITQDLLGRSLDLAVMPPNLVLQLQDKGITALAVLGSERTSLIPQLASLQEQGISTPATRFPPWLGLVAPKGLPESLLKRWTDTLNVVVRDPEFEKFLSTSGLTLIARGPADFAREVAIEYGTTTDLIRSLGITPQ